MAVSGRLPAVLLPVLGALLGLSGGLLILLLPRGPGAIAALALWTGVTLAQGERGMARWFSRLPLFGSLLAACTVLLRWYSLISLHSPPRPMFAAVIVALMLGQVASVALAWVSRPVDDGAFRRLSKLTTTAAIIALAQGAVAAAWFGPRVGSVLAMGVYLLVRLAEWLLQCRYGGVRALDLEALRVTVETGVLMFVSSENIRQ